MKSTMKNVPGPGGKKRERPPLSEAKVLPRGLQGRPVEPLTNKEKPGRQPKKF